MDQNAGQRRSALLGAGVEITMNEDYVKAMVEEMRDLLLYATTRAINLAGALAVANKEIARLQAALPVEPSKETQQ